MSVKVTWQMRTPGAVGPKENLECAPEAWKLMQALWQATTCREDSPNTLLITQDENRAEQRIAAGRSVMLLTLGLPIESSIRLPSRLMMMSTFRARCLHLKNRLIQQVLLDDSEPSTPLQALGSFIGSKARGLTLLHHEDILKSPIVITNDLSHMALLANRGTQGIDMRCEEVISEVPHFDLELRAEGCIFFSPS